ncbi:MAG TPA: hypothetical protein VGJ95_09470 [Pseudonocardiaceae bacterium]|jgi:hypothetical protein
MTALHTTTKATARDGLLRFALRGDAVLSAAAGVPFLLAAGPLSTELGPADWALRALGAGLVGYGVLLWLIAAPARINHRSAWTVVIGNVAWAVLSAVALLAGWLPLTTAGVVVTVVMALHASVFADLQFLGLRRLSA